MNEPWNVHLRILPEGIWHVSCPEAGDSTTAYSFADALAWAVGGLSPKQPITLHLDGI